jgi:hypothetical protein
MKSQAYESAPLPIDMDWNRYGNGKLTYAYVLDRNYGREMELGDAMNYLLSEDKENKYIPEYGITIDHIPSSNLYIDVDTGAVADKIPADLRGDITDRIDIKLEDNNAVMLNQISVLSMLNSIAKDGWNRPIYYAVTVGPDMYLNLDNYFAKVGLAYRILPIKNTDPNLESLVDTEAMYDNMMNKFRWGGVDNPNVYLDETTRKMTYTMRMLFVDLVEALIMEDKYDKALAALDYMMEKIPSSATKHDYLSIQPAMAYYSLGEVEKGRDLLYEVADNSMEYMKWFRGLDYNTLRSISQEYLRHEYTLKTIIKFFVQEGDADSAEKYLYALDELGYNLFKES